MLIKPTLDQGAEQVTSRQELAIESMEDPGRQRDAHKGVESDLEICSLEQQSQCWQDQKP